MLKALLNYNKLTVFSETSDELMQYFSVYDFGIF